MSDRIDDGAQRLDEMAAKLIQFPNTISNELDLAPYMDEQIAHRVKPADAYQDELIHLLLGDDPSQRGTALPWNGLTRRFELRPHEMTVWTGYKGHGKSALISQALNGVMTRGDKVFIVSPEFRPARVLERLLYQKCRTRQPGADELKAWLGWVTPKLWLYDAQASLKPREVVALCRYAATELGVQHILVDSLMKCGIPTDDYNGQKLLVDQLQSIAHKYPLHMHLVAHARKDKDDEKPARLHDIKGASEIADMAENVLSVWRNKRKEKDKSRYQDEPDATLTIEAQRNADGWIGMVPLFFDPDVMLFFEAGNAPERAAYVDF